MNRGALSLRRVMKKLDLSQGDVQRAVSVQSGVVTRWVSGKRRPDAFRAAALQREYGISVHLWWEDVEPPLQRSA